jgi:hypothetical protein
MHDPFTPQTDRPLERWLYRLAFHVVHSLVLGGWRPCR